MRVARTEPSPVYNKFQAWSAFKRIFKIWQQENPGENPRVLAQRALDAVCGVDLNPFAVAIARFRVLLAALQVCNLKRPKDAPHFQVKLAVGDSLIHGARFDSSGQPYLLERQTLFGGDEPTFKDEHAYFFDTEDSAELHRLLGRQYHAVVGNPPYITVKDKASINSTDTDTQIATDNTLFQFRSWSASSILR